MEDAARAAEELCTKQPISELLQPEPVSNVNNVVPIKNNPEPRLAKSSKPKRVTPRKPRNIDRRSREYLTEQEVKQVRQAAAKVGRNGFRDSLLILMTYTHGLRLNELINLRWDQVDFNNSKIYIKRSKGSISGAHPIPGEELRQLRRLYRERKDGFPWLFMSERKGQLSKRAIQLMVQRAGEIAGLSFPIHPHMFRHACGYELINRYDNLILAKDYLGHANLSNTAIYCRLNDKKFKQIELGG